MWVKLRHTIVFSILRVFFSFFLFFKYGYVYKKFRCNIKKPYLILSNHFTALDPFMLALSFNFPIYFVASDDLFSIKYISSIIKYLVAPIPKTKSASDINTIKDCYKIAKEGGSICIFPEGNRTYNGVTTYIPPSIVKLIKLLKLPVLLYRFEGGYGVQPRWAGSIRRGRMRGYVYRILTYEDYSKLSEQQIYKYITDNLFINAFEENKILKKRYKSFKKAQYIERFLYACPDCKNFSTIYSKKNYIICKKCGLQVKYEEDLSLTVKKGKCRFDNVKEWDDFQKKLILETDIENLNQNHILFNDENILLRQNKRCVKKIFICKGSITLYKDKLTAAQSKIFNIKDITSVTVFGKNKLQFYYKDEIFQLIGGKAFNALKYQNMIYHIKNYQEGIQNEFLGL